MTSINQMVLLSVIIALAAGLISNPVAVTPVMAEPPDPCFGGGGCEGSQCTDPEQGYTSCCWMGPNGVDRICQTCKIDYETGDFVYCSTPHNASIGKPDSRNIAPPPSGKAPPPSIEKCPDNSAVDQNGNCTPTTQLSDDTSNNNKPNLRGNILNDMMSTQGQDSPASGEEQENQSND